VRGGRPKQQPTCIRVLYTLAGRAGCAVVDLELRVGSSRRCGLQVCASSQLTACARGASSTLGTGTYRTGNLTPGPKKGLFPAHRCTLSLQPPFVAAVHALPWRACGAELCSMPRHLPCCMPPMSAQLTLHFVCGGGGVLLELALTQTDNQCGHLAPGVCHLQLPVVQQ
jgi:hypothetical protein